MDIEDKIKRHGFNLISLASIGMFFVVILGLVMMWMPFMPYPKLESDIWNRIAGIAWDQVVHLDDAGKRLVSAANFIWMVAYLLPLLALRHLGSSLCRHVALTLPVANAFRWLAHAWVLNAVLPMLGRELIANAEQSSGLTLYLPNLDIGGSYVWLVACVCLYSVAHLMRLAAQAAEDSRSIV